MKTTWKKWFVVIRGLWDHRAVCLSVGSSRIARLTTMLYKKVAKSNEVRTGSYMAESSMELHGSKMALLWMRWWWWFTRSPCCLCIPPPPISVRWLEITLMPMSVCISLICSFSMQSASYQVGLWHHLAIWVYVYPLIFYDCEITLLSASLSHLIFDRSEIILLCVCISPLIFTFSMRSVSHQGGL